MHAAHRSMPKLFRVDMTSWTSMHLTGLWIVTELDSHGCANNESGAAISLILLGTMAGRMPR